MHLVMGSHRWEKAYLVGRSRVTVVDGPGKGGLKDVYPHETEDLLSGFPPLEGVELSRPSLDQSWAPGTSVEPGSPAFRAMHAAMVTGLPP